MGIIRQASTDCECVARRKKMKCNPTDQVIKARFITVEMFCIITCNSGLHTCIFAFCSYGKARCRFLSVNPQTYVRVLSHRLTTPSHHLTPEQWPRRGLRVQILMDKSVYFISIPHNTSVFHQ